MKKRYERPSAYIEEFTPNEYVAACGDEGKVYKFECNAGSKYRNYNVYYYEGKKKNILLNKANGGSSHKHNFQDIIRVTKHMKQDQILVL